MAFAEQIRAYKLNAHRSSEPASLAATQAPAQDDDAVDEVPHDNTSFYFLDDESEEKFSELRQRLVDEHQPVSETEQILVRRMADHEWLRNRALRFQSNCLFEDQHVAATEQFGLYMRYQATHERAFYRAFNELQKLRKQKEKSQIGFVPQKSDIAPPPTAASVNQT